MYFVIYKLLLLLLLLLLTLLGSTNRLIHILYNNKFTKGVLDPKRLGTNGSCEVTCVVPAESYIQ